jgi:hypothetical protein
LDKFLFLGTDRFILATTTYLAVYSLAGFKILEEVPHS